jgi:tripartite-type tricarboxylate transporter receptor subunit TctC
MKNFLWWRLPLAAMCLAISWLFQGPANANDQPWPSGPIKIIVGFAPGGTSDVTARIVGEALSKLLGQPVLVENRPGAQGAIATDTVVRSRPDGYTLLVAPAEALYMPLVDSNARLDIEKTLAPVTILSTQPIVVAVNPSSGWKSIADLIAAAKANPAGVAYATPGPGGTNNIIAELMSRRAGVKFQNIPYKGGGQAVQDLLSGVVPVGILGSAPLMPYVKSGRVTLLAVTSKERSTMLPTVPALAELGYPEIDMTQWFAAFAPAETPKDIVERLSTDLRKVLAEPEVKERLGLAALEPVGESSEEFSKRLQAEGTTWLRTARAFGMGKN